METYYEICVEGYSVTGNKSGASLLGARKANSFNEACEIYSSENPGKIAFNGKYYSDLGCRLFDNERDARKSFG